MSKAEKIISEFFKSYFKKYPSFESLFFLIYNFDSGIYLADEDCRINGQRWDELSDDELYESSYKIEKAIESLRESKVDTGKIISELENIVVKLRKESDDSNPLNKIFEDVWSKGNQRALTKKVKKLLEKEIPWKYVSYCECTVKRDGTVEIEDIE